LADNERLAFQGVFIMSALASIDIYMRNGIDPKSMLQRFLDSGWTEKHDGDVMFLNSAGYDDFEWEIKRAQDFKISDFIVDLEVNGRGGIVLVADGMHGGAFDIGRKGDRFIFLL
jgi:hypothetical protein